MNAWCPHCSKFSHLIDAYCASCGADLLWAPRVNKKTCEYCKREEAAPGNDLCTECASDVLQIVGEDMEIALDTFPDLCPYCLVRVLHGDDEECYTCRVAEAWETDPKDVTWKGGSESLAWEETDPGYVWWNQAEEPVVIPTVEEELESIPAIR
jgi:hypothetical protein